jgi:hypothetical protein
MRVSFIVIFCLLQFSGSLFGQDDLFGPSEHKEARHGFVLNGNGAIDLPGGDMAKRFSNSFRLGPALLYKTTSNWLFGAKFDFIMGKNVSEDSLMINIRDKYQTYSKNLYEFINNDGQRIGVPVYERGYAVGVSLGKIFSHSKEHPDNGVMVLTSAGFIQHRINIYDKDKSVMQLRGHYLKGYDRLTNGFFVEQFLGYIYFSNNKLINFNIGADFLAGFTEGRRDYLYDVMRPDKGKRLDILYGIRAGWFIPMFKRKSEDLLFE